MQHKQNLRDHWNGTASRRNITYSLENSVEFFNEGNGWTGPPISVILLIMIRSCKKRFLCINRVYGEHHKSCVFTNKFFILSKVEMTDGIGPVRPDAIISLQETSFSSKEKKRNIKEEFEKKDVTVS